MFGVLNQDKCSNDSLKIQTVENSAMFNKPSLKNLEVEKATCKLRPPISGKYCSFNLTPPAEKT